jgi:heme/copper-type cytochrome/quinol oxidase subunit 3
LSSHSVAVAHQFEDMGQQLDTSTFGMWVFLVTEIMFFGGMFAAYTVYRYSYPEAFAAASRHMNVLLGGTNTIVLITSSLTMGQEQGDDSLSGAYAAAWLHVPRHQGHRVLPEIPPAPHSRSLVLV